MVFLESVNNRKCMFCARGGDSNPPKNRSGNPGQKLPCIQEMHTNYHPIDDPRESNRSLIYNEPSDSYFYFTKSSVAAATNTSAHTNTQQNEMQKYVYQVPKAEIKSTQNGTSSEFGRFSYNWVDTTPTVVSVMCSVDFANDDNSNATAKSKSDSNTEMFNSKTPKRTKPPQNRTKMSRNVKLSKINSKNRRKDTLKANSASSCSDSLQSAIHNLGSFFEDLLKTTLNTDQEVDTAINDEKKSNSSLPSSYGSSVDTFDEPKSVLDSVDIKKHARGTVSWDFTAYDTSRSVMTDFVDWANDAGYHKNQLVCNKTSKVNKSQRSRPATATSQESLYTEINASSFVNLRRKSNTSKRKRSYDFPHMNIFNLPLRKAANKYDSPKKLKPRRMSNKKRIITYLKKRLSDGDRKGSFNNGAQSEFFKSLKNIAFLKKRLNKEQHFFDEPKANTSKKHKCSKASRKHSKNNSRRSSAKAVKRKKY